MKQSEIGNGGFPQHLHERGPLWLVKKRGFGIEARAADLK
jgi:hypothetical protein